MVLSSRWRRRRYAPLISARSSRYASAIASRPWHRSACPPGSSCASWNGKPGSSRRRRCDAGPCSLGRRDGCSPSIWRPDLLAAGPAQEAERQKEVERAHAEEAARRRAVVDDFVVALHREEGIMRAQDRALAAALNGLSDRWAREDLGDVQTLILDRATANHLQLSRAQINDQAKEYMAVVREAQEALMRGEPWPRPPSPPPPKPKPKAPRKRAGDESALAPPRKKKEKAVAGPAAAAGTGALQLLAGAARAAAASGGPLVPPPHQEKIPSPRPPPETPGSIQVSTLAADNMQAVSRPLDMSSFGGWADAPRGPAPPGAGRQVPHNPAVSAADLLRAGLWPATARPAGQEANGHAFVDVRAEAQPHMRGAWPGPGPAPGGGGLLGPRPVGLLAPGCTSAMAPRPPPTTECPALLPPTPSLAGTLLPAVINASFQEQHASGRPHIGG